MTAKLIKSTLLGFRGTAHLYKLSEPVTFDYDWNTGMDTKNTNYVVVSEANIPYSGSETYIFPADKDGEVLSWLELKGSFRGELNHERALQNAGYEVI